MHFHFHTKRPGDINGLKLVFLKIAGLYTNGVTTFDAQPITDCIGLTVRLPVDASGQEIPGLLKWRLVAAL